MSRERSVNIHGRSRGRPPGRAKTSSQEIPPEYAGDKERYLQALAIFEKLEVQNVALTPITFEMVFKGLKRDAIISSKED